MPLLTVVLAAGLLGSSLVRARGGQRVARGVCRADGEAAARGAAGFWPLVGYIPVPVTWTLPGSSPMPLTVT